MAAFAFDYADNGFEGIFPESFGAENAQLGYYPGWDSLDPNLEAMRQNHPQYGLNLEQNYLLHHRYFSSYNGAAHGFTLDSTMKQAETQLYQLGLDTQWHGEYDRQARQFSPTSSGASLSSSTSSMSDYPLSPDASKDAPFFATTHNVYPSPISESYTEQMSPGYYPQPSSMLGFMTPVVPNQSSLSMREIQFSPDAQMEDDFAEEGDTITVSAHPPEVLELSERPGPDDSGPLSDQEAESDDEEQRMRDESDNDSEFTPRRATRRPPSTPLRSSQSAHRRTASTAHPVQDPNARIHKPTPSKSKAKLGRKPSFPANGTTRAKSKSFPCPFAAFGCVSIFPSKNEWKRHTASQHLQLGFYRCDLGACSPDHPSQLTQTRGYNDFNRKDLFTQHCRRMHWDECEGLKGSKVKGKEWAVWSVKEKQKFEEFMEDVRDRCWTQRRGPPAYTSCGMCDKVFDDEKNDEEGKAWEERMEHVGRHYERGDTDVEMRVDEGIQQWCVDNHTVMWVDGRYWLKGCEPEESRVRSGRRGTRRGLRREENGHVEKEHKVKVEKEVQAEQRDDDEDTDAAGEEE